MIISKERKKLFIVLIEQLLLSGLSFLITIAITMFFTKETLANYVLLLSVTMFVLGVQRALISTPFALNQNDFKAENFEIYYQNTLKLKLIFSLLIFILLTLVFFSKLDFIELAIYQLFVFSFSSYHFIREVMLTKRNVFKNFYYGIVITFLILLSLVLTYYKKIDEFHFLLLLFSIIYLGAFVIFYIKDFNNLYKFDLFEILKTKWETGKWLFGTNIFYHLSAQIYPWIILYYFTKNEIALLGVLNSISNLVTPVIKSLNAYLLPIFVSVNKDFKYIRSFVKKWVGVFGLIALVISLVGFFFGENVIQLFFGAEYVMLGYVIVLPFVNQSVSVVFQPLKLAFDSTKKTHINFWLIVLKALVSLIFGFYFVHRYGVAGVFICQVLENVIYGISILILFKRTYVSTKTY